MGGVSASWPPPRPRQEDRPWQHSLLRSRGPTSRRHAASLTSAAATRTACTRAGSCSPARRSTRSLFIVPTFASFYFAFTRWTFFDVEFIGFENFITFFADPQLSKAFINTLIYGALTSVRRSCSGSPRRAAHLRHPGARVPARRDLLPRAGQHGRRRHHLPGAAGPVRRRRQQGARRSSGSRARLAHRPQPGAVLDHRASTSGRVSVSRRSSTWPGSSPSRASTTRLRRSTARARWANFCYITLPLVRPATTTVVILSLIGGLRSFEIIWATTGGGPGFSSDVLASVIYKQYAGRVLRTLHGGQRRPVRRWSPPSSCRCSGGSTESRRICEARARHPQHVIGDRRDPRCPSVIFLVPFAFIVLSRSRRRRSAASLDFTLADRVRVLRERRRGLPGERLHAGAWRSSTARS